MCTATFSRTALFCVIAIQFVGMLYMANIGMFFANSGTNSARCEFQIFLLLKIEINLKYKFNIINKV